MAKVWMMNPGRFPSGGRLTPAVIISDEPEDLQAGSAVAIKNPDEVFYKSDTAVEKEVEHLKRYGFVVVEPKK